MIFPNPFRALASAARMLWWKINGWAVLLEPHEQQNRLNKCNRCLVMNPESRQCEICTCFVDAKTLLAPERCPLGLWERQRRLVRQPLRERE
jgi:hypothetical protein